MPVKAKRSTYNYSLPITVKKTRECLCLPRRLRLICPHRDTKGDGCWDGGVWWGEVGWGRMGWGFPGAAPGYTGQHPGEGDGEHPAVFQVLLLSLAASQVVTMQDLKQGLGPSGTASSRKSNSNKYKLKVGTP